MDIYSRKVETDWSIFMYWQCTQTFNAAQAGCNLQTYPHWHRLHTYSLILDPSLLKTRSLTHSGTQIAHKTIIALKTGNVLTNTRRLFWCSLFRCFFARLHHICNGDGNPCQKTHMVGQKHTWFSKFYRQWFRRDNVFACATKFYTQNASEWKSGLCYMWLRVNDLLQDS